MPRADPDLWYYAPETPTPGQPGQAMPPLAWENVPPFDPKSVTPIPNARTNLVTTPRDDLAPFPQGPAPYGTFHVPEGWTDMPQDVPGVGTVMVPRPDSITPYGGPEKKISYSPYDPPGTQWLRQQTQYDQWLKMLGMDDHPMLRQLWVRMMHANTVR